MRSNGLTAQDYAPLAVLPPSVAADALLALREAGVAAYAVQPEDADESHPEQATLFADRAALQRARAVVLDLAPDATEPPSSPAVDEVAWQQIVSGFSATAPEPDHGADTEDSTDAAGRDDDTSPPAPTPHPLVRDDDEHFVPDPPWPGPRLDLVTRLAWAGVLGGPLLLLAAALVSWAPPRVVLMLCAVGFVGGITTLVLRMKDRPPHDDGPDDGAVI
ncbi:MAG: hypothetical protein M3165_03880 [Actinomycetota bacterium]|nr:hypothetical protein [Actinomycetota bacterium]